MAKGNDGGGDLELAARDRAFSGMDPATQEFAP